MREVRFEVIGAAIPQGSMRAFSTKTGRTVVVTDNPNLHQWRDSISWAAREELSSVGIREPWVGAVSVAATFWLPRPTSVSIKRRPEPVVKPDLDKLIRAVLDALSGLVYRDDAQVCHITVDKRYADGRDAAAAIRAWREGER